MTDKPSDRAIAQAALLPCPLCGHTPRIKYAQQSGGIVCPEGSTCFGSGLCFLFLPENEQSAIAAWNTRAAAPDGVDTITPAELWKAIDGNPGMTPSKTDALDAARCCAEAADACVCFGIAAPDGAQAVQPDLWRARISLTGYEMWTLWSKVLDIERGGYQTSSWLLADRMNRLDEYEVEFAYFAPPSQDVEDAPDSDWRLKGYVYASKQATHCAGCGEHKHTPLRVDWMGGYVCLTCIDKEMEKRDPDEGLLAAVNSACGELPDGWSIELNIENGYGGIELFNDEGEKIPSEECLVDDCTLAEDIRNAVQFAIDATRAAGEPT